MFPLAAPFQLAEYAYEWEICGILQWNNELVIHASYISNKYPLNEQIND